MTPKYLNTIGKALFNEFKGNLAPTPNNLTTLGLLARAYQDWREAIDALDAQGKVIETATGSIKANPWQAIQKQAYETYIRLCVELQLTPKSQQTDELQTDTLDRFAS